ncbi:hypothetical protein bAD24_p01055 (plasmid) [Burkholderia sp. AD24]|nr:hypothetical protein bAD24_p01055 [Burkholderia sp. AD24]
MSIFVGRKTARIRLSSWQYHAPRFEARFDSERVEAQQDYFESLRVYADGQHRTVQLLPGNHPSRWLESEKRFEVEGGAALVVSQNSDSGHVAIFIYPYERQASAASPLILWALFDSPEDVTNEWLDRALSDFARVCRASSVVDDTTVHADRRRFFWLRCRSRWLRLVGRFPWWYPLVRDRPSLSRKAWLWIVGTVFGLGVFLTVPSEIATLWGFTVPGLLKDFRHVDTAASAPIGTSATAQASADMPVITGWYTFCPQDNSGASPRLLDLLYDIGQNAGKVAFFDIQVGVDCVMGTASDPSDLSAPFARTAGEHSLTYRFSPDSASRNTIDGGRDSAKLDRFLPANGSLVSVLDDRDGRNALTRLDINSEGVDDALYGPYLIKARGEDASLSLELSAPTLDTAMQAAAATIAAQRRVAHEKEPPPRGLPPPISFSAADLRRFHDLAASSAVPPPTALPPLDARSLSRLPPLPTPLAMLRPASLPGVAAGAHGTGRTPGEP